MPITLRVIFLVGVLFLHVAHPLLAENASGRRQLPEYEADVYGPLPFSEEVTGFLDHEIGYILERQNKDGSWDSAEPIGNGKTRMEAGGTVDNITLTSMCGYSLRKHLEVDEARIEPAVRKALDFVLYMILSGKLRNNVTDAPWRYTYALRFLIHEYPFQKDPAVRKSMLDGSEFIINELVDMQHGTYGQKAKQYSWKKYASLGMEVADGQENTLVVSCPKECAAYKAGLRVGDRLLGANDQPLMSAKWYYFAERDWLDGDVIKFKLMRNGTLEEVDALIPAVYPGTLGIKWSEEAEGLRVSGFEFASNPTNETISAGDVLLSVDNRPVKTLTELSAFPLRAGHKVKLKIKRSNQIYELDLTCAPIPAADLGVELAWGLDQSSLDGFKIEKLSKDSCLGKAGLQPGDRILRVDGIAILNVRHFRQVERSIWNGKTLAVEYLDAQRQKKSVEVQAGAVPDVKWLKGYHGINLGKTDEPIVEAVEYASPAKLAGMEKQDRIQSINGQRIDKTSQLRQVLSNIAAGARVDLKIDRGGQPISLSFNMNRHPDSVWLARDDGSGGGWGYLLDPRGSNTFLTSDAIRELLKVRSVLKLNIPESLPQRSFKMLTALRMKQPNSEVDSYRYDAAGSFWSIKDIRADVGRLPSAELSCVMYTDSGLKCDAPRGQPELEKALKEWLVHRGILDLVKFPKGHDKYSIAPYFWMYSYRTTLEAAEYLKSNDTLKLQVQRTALKAFFKHMEFRFEKILGRKAWIIGLDNSKELHDSCQLLDGLATIKHLYKQRVRVTTPQLKDLMEKFYASEYGPAYLIGQELLKSELPAKGKEELNGVLKQINDRFSERLGDVKAIYAEYPYDGLYHLEQMEKIFLGHPGMKNVEELKAAWKERLKSSR